MTLNFIYKSNDTCQDTCYRYNSILCIEVSYKYPLNYKKEEMRNHQENKF